MHFIKIFFLAFMLCLSATSSFAQNISTKINAESMHYSAKDNSIKFNKNVFIERENFYLWADSIIVHLSKNSNLSANNMQGFKEADIESIEAIGNVSIEYLNSRGWCGKAMYEVKTNSLSMQENPLLEEGDNSIQGSEIMYYLDENRSEIVGGSTRVKAVFSRALQFMDDSDTKNESE